MWMLHCPEMQTRHFLVFPTYISPLFVGQTPAITRIYPRIEARVNAGIESRECLLFLRPE